MKTNILKLFIFSFGLLAMSCDKEENILESENLETETLTINSSLDESEQGVQGKIIATASVEGEFKVDFIEHEPGVSGMLVYGLSNKISKKTAELFNETGSYKDIYLKIAHKNAIPEYVNALSGADKRAVQHKKDLESGKIQLKKPLTQIEDKAEPLASEKINYCPNNTANSDLFNDILEDWGSHCGNDYNGYPIRCTKGIGTARFKVGNSGLEYYDYRTIGMSGDGQSDPEDEFWGEGARYTVWRGMSNGNWEEVVDTKLRYEYQEGHRWGKPTLHKWVGYIARDPGFFQSKIRSLTECRNGFMWHTILPRED